MCVGMHVCVCVCTSVIFLKARIVTVRIKNSGIGKLRFFTFYYDMKDVKN